MNAKTNGSNERENGNGNAEVKSFPSICFWDKKAEVISMVNPGDFKRDYLLEKLGIDNMSISKTFGAKDRNEILRRQSIVRFLMENPDIGDFLNGENGRMDRFSRLSDDSQEFLDEFWVDPESEHNRFFGMIQKLKGKLGAAGKLPNEIEKFYYFLKSTTSSAEALENSLSREMGEEIQKATFLQGTVTISVQAGASSISSGWKMENSEIYGYQKYSYRLSGFCEPTKRPNWLENKVFQFLGISQLSSFIFDEIDKSRKKKGFADLLITKMPEELEKPIMRFVQEKFSDQIYKMNRSCKAGKIILEDDDNIFFEFHLRYEKDKLALKLVNFYFRNKLDKPCKPDVKSGEEEFMTGNYLGYSWSQRRRIAKKNKLIAENVDKIFKQMNFSMKFLKFVEESAKELVKDGFTITSSELENRFKWYTVDGLRQTPQLVEKCKKAEQYRLFVSSKFNELNEISQLVNCLVNKSEEWNLPLHFPEILSNSNHVVSFDQLIPVHLIGRRVGEKIIGSKDLVPISSLVPLNGRMIGLTGQNSGGKTVTEEAIVAAVYFAQSGLPVFGTNLALNAKSTIGMVFLERGEGSTVELMLRKTMKVLQAVQQSPENSILVVLDEVGSGTQESAVLGLAERILTKLGKSGCSILFSTQITALAQKAEKNMDAICFKVDMDHRIQPGIGVGEVDRLAEKVGINSFLK